MPSAEAVPDGQLQQGLTTYQITAFPGHKDWFGGHVSQVQSKLESTGGFHENGWEEETSF